jgi:hypothetical protein
MIFEDVEQRRSLFWELMYLDARLVSSIPVCSTSNIEGSSVAILRKTSIIVHQTYGLQTAKVHLGRLIRPCGMYARLYVHDLTIFLFFSQTT